MHPNDVEPRDLHLELSLPLCFSSPPECRLVLQNLSTDVRIHLWEMVIAQIRRCLVYRDSILTPRLPTGSHELQKSRSDKLGICA